MSPSSDVVLVQLDKLQAAKLSPDLLADIKGLQELQSSWIAEIPRSLLTTLSGRGVACGVLDEAPAGKAYFLVFTPQPGQADILKKFGNAIVLEERTCLFWSGAEEARDILPSYFEIKRLSLEDGIPLSFEKIRPKGRLPERLEIPRAAADPLISQMVSQVSKANLTNYISNLQNFQTRYASTANCESSGTYLYNYFTQLGLACEYDPFSFSQSGYSSRNVVATILGKTSPDREVIICAHYDSYSNQKMTLAPGADDNGSGTAAVMEIARIFAGQAFDFTLKFICFSAEEWGLYGSQHYARTAKNQGEKIIGVINMDMVAFTDRLPPDLEVYVNSRSEWLAGRYIQAANTYAPLRMEEVIDASADWSDHSSFWDEDYSALCSIEEASDRNPYYHKTTDTLDKLNMDFAVSVTKASLAAAAELAQPIGTLAAPTGLQAHSQISSSLFSSIKTVYLGWNVSPGSINGYNIYRSTTSHSGYHKVNSALVSQTSFVDRYLSPDVFYYYVVTAVDAQGRESNYSTEVRDDEDNKKTYS